MNGHSEHVSGDARSQLREYLAVLWVRKWSILLVTILVLGGALLYSSRQVPLYRSSARILLQGSATSAPVPGGQAGAGSTTTLQTEGEILRSREVAEEVAENLGLPPDARALQSGLSVEIQPESQIMVVSYVSQRALEAQQRAQAFANGYLDHRRERLSEDLAAQQQALNKQIAQLQKRLDAKNKELAGTGLDDPARTGLQAQVGSLVGQIGALQTQLGAISAAPPPTVGEIIEPAALPSAPVSPNHVRAGAVAGVVGIFLGIAIAFLRERLDDRLRGRMDLERYLGAPVLAVVPHLSSWRRRTDTPLVTAAEPRSGVSEAYRTLRTSLLFTTGQRQAKTLMVTSAHAGEGKTATAANLGVSLAQAGKRVILLSADLRKPRIHRFFNGRVEEIGLTSILSGEIKPWEGVADVGHENLRLVPSGPVPGNPAELLGSDAMGQLLAQFREIADLVIIDSAPVLVVADALTIAPFVDAVLFVADAERTNRGAVVHAREALEQVDAPIIGAVLNNFDPSKGRKTSYYYYGYYYSHYQYEDGGGRRRGRKARRQPAAGFERTPQSQVREGLQEHPVWPAQTPVATSPQQHLAAPQPRPEREAAPVAAPATPAPPARQPAQPPAQATQAFPASAPVTPPAPMPVETAPAASPEVPPTPPPHPVWEPQSSGQPPWETTEPQAQAEQPFESRPEAPPSIPPEGRFEPEPASGVSGNDASGHHHGAPPGPPPSSQPMETGPPPQPPPASGDRPEDTAPGPMAPAGDEAQSPTFFPDERPTGQPRDPAAYRETRETPPEHQRGDAQTVPRE